MREAVKGQLLLITISVAFAYYSLWLLATVRSVLFLFFPLAIRIVHSYDSVRCSRLQKSSRTC